LEPLLAPLREQIASLTEENRALKAALDRSA
jgi:hypothetical protein